uniref:Uncharacterized protein n=1 Tax=Anguilla anguilla TaxID=7936 RepID=A0A0E9QY19_ANGAN
MTTSSFAYLNLLVFFPIVWLKSFLFRVFLPKFAGSGPKWGIALQREHMHSAESLLFSLPHCWLRC